MSTKTWKEHLLSSGVPLEYSIIRIFEELGINNPAEYRYERKTETGVSQVFSVDVKATKYDLGRSLYIDCLVECKYRHDETNWVFMPRDYEEFFGPGFADLFVTLDKCCVERQLDRSILQKFESTYPLCSKGVELLPKDANPKAIEQAIQQLRYAVVSRAIECIDDQLFRPPDMTIPIWVIIPIIVTTADLWRLKVGTTVDDVRNAKDIDTVADHLDVLVLLQDPDHLDAQDTKARFREGFNDEQRATLDGLLHQTQSGGLGMFIANFANRTPSMFIIISYKRLKSAMKNLHAFFDNDRLITKREIKAPTKKPTS
jgi:hypothetical protein